MPSFPNGFTGNEIVTRVQKYVGNFNNDFKEFVEQTLPLAEFRYYKLHDWSFLRKTGLSLPVTNGQSEYTLDSGTIGELISASDIETIYDPTNGRVLKKVDLPQIRRLDPEEDDGSSTHQGPQLWAEAGYNKIILWPPKFESGTIKMDVRIQTPQLTNLTNTPLIPYKYQEGFIEYVIAIALDRENDTRASTKKSEALQLIRLDIQDDMRRLGDTTEARIKHWREARLDGVGGANLDALLFGLADELT